MSKLAPCPFCGNTSLFVGYDSPGYAVRCSCGASLSNFEFMYDEESAIKLWNQRVVTLKVTFNE